MSGYIGWCLETEQQASDIAYILYAFYQPEEDDDFTELWVPLCEAVYESLAARKQNGLLYKYMLWSLYEHFSVEQDDPQKCILSEDECSEMEELDSAVSDLHWYMNPEDQNEREDKEEVLRIIRCYYSSWNDLEKIFEISNLDHYEDGYVLLVNLLSEYMTGNIPKDAWKKLCRDMLVKGYLYEDWWGSETRHDIFSYLMEPLFEAGDDEMCLHIFHAWRDVIRLEEFLRGCHWSKWSAMANYDLIYSLLKRTSDQGLKEVHDYLINNIQFDRDELEDIDEQLLYTRPYWMEVE